MVRPRREAPTRPRSNCAIQVIARGASMLALSPVPLSGWERGQGVTATYTLSRGESGRSDRPTYRRFTSWLLISAPVWRSFNRCSAKKSHMRWVK